MTHSPLFSQTESFLEVLVVNAKLAEFPSSLPMQSASCLTFELEAHKTLLLMYNLWNQEDIGHMSVGSYQTLIQCEVTMMYIGFNEQSGV